jgi:phenylpropionate dioxygenase-like ring-hydroxylating dioxygenase large terminal subunit
LTVPNIRRNRIFNQKDRFVEGWYWALPSTELARGAVRPMRLLGRDLAIFRGEDGRAVALDAYCPHMGAHLAEGRVDGNHLRCFFHDWKFDCTGSCVEAPRMDKPPRAHTRAWPTAERYGMIWVWAGASPARELPYVPELKDIECDALIGNRFIKNCHPNVVLINAIDENHFNSVHDLPVDLLMKTEAVNENVQTFSNTTRVPDSNLLTRALGRFYAGPLTYSMCYHYGATGTVTVGPDLMHFHIMFALRLIEDGKTEGQTILITRRRPGVAGRAFNRVALAATKVVGDYFAKGDTQVFQTMKFDFATPTKADHAIVDFIQHVEKQRALAFGSWANVGGPAASAAAGDEPRDTAREVLHA